jgi:hypothetical protein
MFCKYWDMVEGDASTRFYNITKNKEQHLPSEYGFLQLSSACFSVLPHVLFSESNPSDVR